MSLKRLIPQERLAFPHFPIGDYSLLEVSVLEENFDVYLKGLSLLEEFFGGKKLEADKVRRAYLDVKGAVIGQHNISELEEIGYELQRLAKQLGLDYNGNPLPIKEVKQS